MLWTDLSQSSIHKREICIEKNSDHFYVCRIQNVKKHWSLPQYFGIICGRFALVLGSILCGALGGFPAPAGGSRAEFFRRCSFPHHHQHHQHHHHSSASAFLLLPAIAGVSPPSTVPNPGFSSRGASFPLGWQQNDTKIKFNGNLSNLSNYRVKIKVENWLGVSCLSVSLKGVKCLLIISIQTVQVRSALALPHLSFFTFSSSPVSQSFFFLFAAPEPRTTHLGFLCILRDLHAISDAAMKEDWNPEKNTGRR